VRFYDLKLSNAAGQVYQPSASGNGFVLATGGSTFTTHPKGVNNPGALNLEGDIVTYNAAEPQGNSYIKIHGVSLGMLGQASNLNGANFMLFGGMKPGLPLATAQAPQAGILAQGQVFQAFGNWQGTDQTLDLIFNPGSLDSELDPFIVFNWQPGVPLAQALASTLSQAFPGFKQKISIANLVQSYASGGVYTNIWQFASVLKGLTKKIGASIFGPQYPGVQIACIGGTVVAYDTTVATPVKMIAFQDMIGQPSWLDPATISFKTVLRSDISPSTQIQFPQGAPALFAMTAQTAAVPGSPASSKTAFQGKFFVHTVHHYMHLRQGDGDSWASVFTASPITLTNN
jgi:hypothetical protein